MRPTGIRETAIFDSVLDPARLFATSTGGTVSASAVWRIWRAARVVGLSPEQQLTPLAGRPYDLRHACATLLLNASVPPKEVARRLGQRRSLVEGVRGLPSTAMSSASTA